MTTALGALLLVAMIIFDWRLIFLPVVVWVLSELVRYWAIGRDWRLLRTVKKFREARGGGGMKVVKGNG